MTKLALRTDLDDLRTKLTASFDPDKRRVFVCMGTGCKACGGEDILSSLDESLKHANLDE